MPSLYRSFMKSFIMIIFTVTLLLLIFVLGPMSAFYGEVDFSTNAPIVKKVARSNITKNTKLKNSTQNFTEVFHLTLKDIITRPSVVREYDSKLQRSSLVNQSANGLQNFDVTKSFDHKLYDEDIECSKAYAKSITRVGLLTRKECHNILDGLEMIAIEWKNETFDFKPNDKDIHSANERRLGELIGSAANKLNAGWDRNDQLATSLRLWQKKAISIHKNHLLELLSVITECAEKESDILMAGYNNMQRARPIRWSHWLLSFGWKIKRDIERLMELHSRVDLLPLGSGALAGNPFGVDRIFLAKELGFSDVIENSIDAVNDRDFVLEYLAWASMMAVHFSHLAEDLLLYSSKEYGFVELSGSFRKGLLNIVPNKNVNSLEVIRKKTSDIFGHYTDMLAILKGLPSIHNHDLLVDKKGMFDISNTLNTALPMAKVVLSSLKINKDKMEASLSEAMLLPDLEYYMVRKGLSSDKAHSLVNTCVAMAQKKEVTLSKLSLADLRSISPVFDHDVASVWNYNNSVEQYTTTGGTSLSSVQHQIEQIKKWMTFQR